MRKPDEPGIWRLKKATQNRRIASVPAQIRTVLPPNTKLHRNANTPSFVQVWSRIYDTRKNLRPSYQLQLIHAVNAWTQKHAAVFKWKAVVFDGITNDFLTIRPRRKQQFCSTTLDFIWAHFCSTVSLTQSGLTIPTDKTNQALHKQHRKGRFVSLESLTTLWTALFKPINRGQMG
jgi:hypothetical protein